MSYQEEITYQQDLLATYRRKLAYTIKQQARLGITAPFSLVEDIREARDAIGRIKTTLREQGEAVEDLPPDREPATDRESEMPSPAQPISQGFIALISLFQVPGVHTAALTFRTYFEAACDQIKVVNYYKQLHDLFQDLELSYNVIENDRQRLTDAEDLWDSLALHEPDVQGEIEDLLTIADHAANTLDSSWWKQQLVQTRDDLHMAVETTDPALLLLTMRRLYRVLDREPSRINTRLVAATEALRLADLITAMTIVRNSLSVSVSQTTATQQLITSIESITQLNAHLRSCIAYHQCWQDIDNELRRVEANIIQDSSELALAWPDLKAMMMKLCQENTDDWAASLQRIGADLENALALHALDKLRRCFRQYRCRVSRCFRQADDELVEICHNLQKIGYALTMLLEALE